MFKYGGWVLTWTVLLWFMIDTLNGCSVMPGPTTCLNTDMGDDKNSCNRPGGFGCDLAFYDMLQGRPLPPLPYVSLCLPTSNYGFVFDKHFPLEPPIYHPSFFPPINSNALCLKTSSAAFPHEMKNYIVVILTSRRDTADTTTDKMN